MTLTPAEVNALLGLPEAAHAKLAAIEGPGWAVARKPDVFGGPFLHVANSVGSDCFVWCPVDTFAIVQACGAGPTLKPHVGGWRGRNPPAFCASVTDAAGYGDTPRLAALELLGTVCA